jgi:hypothetical protein
MPLGFRAHPFGRGAAPLAIAFALAAPGATYALGGDASGRPVAEPAIELPSAVPSLPLPSLPIATPTSSVPPLPIATPTLVVPTPALPMTTLPVPVATPTVPVVSPTIRPSPTPGPSPTLSPSVPVSSAAPGSLSPTSGAGAVLPTVGPSLSPEATVPPESPFDAVVVPGLLFGIPTMLLLGVVVVQAVGGAAWLPAIRRWMNGRIVPTEERPRAS